MLPAKIDALRWRRLSSCAAASAIELSVAQPLLAVHGLARTKFNTFKHTAAHTACILSHLKLRTLPESHRQSWRCTLLPHAKLDTHDHDAAQAISAAST